MRTSLTGCMVFTLMCTLLFVLPAGAVVNGQIAFVSTRDGNTEIYVMNPDGSNQSDITKDGYDESFPAWSPDGTRIAFGFSSESPYFWHIYAMDADGSHRTLLTGDETQDWGPAWSPDGARIAFISYRDRNDEIYVMNADGSNPTRLTTYPGLDMFPAWSPDGTKIAFESLRSGNWQIEVMNADGSNQVQLTDAAGGAYEPAWSPDGTKIAFRTSLGGNWEIFAVNLDGSGQTDLTNNPGGDFSPAWSPDGSKIAFSSDRDGNEEIYIMNADGSNQVDITNNPGNDFDPAWGAAAFTNSIGYTATVLCDQNTVIQASNGVFGSILRGTSKTISPSVVLNNNGCNPAKVEARFADNPGGIFGLISGMDVLAAHNFEMGPTGTLVALKDDGTDQQVATAPVGITNLDAKLSVPATQAPGAYSGNVILTFSNGA